LNKKIENFAFAVDCPPEMHSVSSERNDHLIEVPVCGAMGSLLLNASADRGLEPGLVVLRIGSEELTCCGIV
jgi:hypothetical protein